MLNSYGFPLQQNRPGFRPMSRPISKAFKRISDFIFPDTIRIPLPEESIPTTQPDLIIVDRIPVEQLENSEFLYREKQIEKIFSDRFRSTMKNSNQPIDKNQTISDFNFRPTESQEKLRERKKRHTIDDVQNSTLKNNLEEIFTKKKLQSSLTDNESSTDTEIIEKTSPKTSTNSSFRSSNVVLPTVWEQAVFNSVTSRKLPNSLNDQRRTSLIENLISNRTEKRTQIRKTNSFNDRSSSIKRPAYKNSIRPYFLIRPQTVLVLPNEIARFKCCFSSEPAATIIWSHKGFSLSGSTMNEPRVRYRTQKLNEIHYLEIGPIVKEDGGEVKCTLSNKFDREIVSVELIVVPTVADGIPKIIRPLRNRKLIVGSTLVVSCLIDALQSTIFWFHNGKLLKTNENLKKNYQNELVCLELNECDLKTAGTIDFLVRNRFGEVRSSCQIEIVER